MGAEYIIEGCWEQGKKLLWWVFLIGLLGGCCVGFTWHCSVKSIPDSPPDAIIESPTTHVVQTGETLTSIAKQVHIAWYELARINNLSNPDMLKVGQVLRLKE